MPVPAGPSMATITAAGAVRSGGFHGDGHLPGTCTGRRRTRCVQVTGPRTPRLLARPRSPVRAVTAGSTSPARAAPRSAPARPRLHHQLDQTGLLAGGVLDPDVLDVDARPGRRRRRSGPARPAGRRCGRPRSRRRPGRRRACRGPGPARRCRGAARPRSRRRRRRRLASSADCRARSARTVSSRSAATSASTSATGPGLAERMSIHIAGSEAAIRVTSRMPWPQSRTAVSSALLQPRRDHAGDQMRGVRDERDGPVVRVGVHHHRDGAAERDQFQGEVEHLGVGVAGRGEHPGPALEEVRGGGQRPGALPPGHRMRADVARSGRSPAPPAPGAARP